jgi:hypothetical protein
VSDSKALAIVPRSIDEVHSLAEVLSKSTLLPDALKGKVPDIVVSILAGQELGLGPMASIRGVHVVQGKPVLASDTMVGLILASGLAEYFICVEDTDARVTYETKRRGSPHPVRASWTREDTKRAGLNTKDNWRLYERQMMKARCRSILARDNYPDVLAGCYDSDSNELQQAPVASAPREVIEDAEVVEPGAEMIAEINATENPAQLDALAPKINKMPKGSPERVASMTAFKAKQAIFAPPVSNGVNHEAVTAP